MGNFKKTIWVAGKLFWYQKRDFLSLIREFSGGKLKQKGFFHSAGFMLVHQTTIRYGSCLLDSYFLDRSFKMYFAGKLDGFDKN
jgi:hypothetical protein